MLTAGAIYDIITIDSRKGIEKMTIENMITAYVQNAFTHHYIIGIKDNGIVKACFTTSEILPHIMKLATASRGNGASVRFKPNNKQREYLKQNAERIENICTVEELENRAEKVGKQKNRGIAFENLLHEKIGEAWKHNNTSFQTDGDITINGIAYQIKFEQSTLCNEKQINRLGMAV